MISIAINLAAMHPDYRGGVNTYIQGLLNGLNQISDREFKITIVCRTDNQHLFSDYAKVKNFHIKALPPPSIFKKILRNLFAILQIRPLFEFISNNMWAEYTQCCDRCDVVYTPTTILNAFNSTKPNIVSMHDIQHVHFPQFFSYNQRLIRNSCFHSTAKHADTLQASSDYIQEDLLDNFNNLEKKNIPVIREGVDINLYSVDVMESDLDIKVKYKLPEKFFFYPAQLWPHKNHITILKALNELKKENSRVILVLTGDKYSSSSFLFEYIRENDLNNQVIYLGLVPLIDLMAIYRAAYYVIIAVLYESSSLPILEAAASGTPIIASDTQPNRELAKKLMILFFSPLDHKELAKVIKTTLNSDQCKNQIVHNMKKISYYSWKSVALDYLDLFASKQ